MKKLILLAFYITTTFAGTYPSLLFHGNCVTCHLLNSSKSAPSIKEVKKAYINAYPKEEDFVKFMSTWVLNPNATTSIMQEAVEKYELMPHLAYDKNVLEEISLYIYTLNFDK